MTPDPGHPAAPAAGRVTLDPHALRRAAAAFHRASIGYDARGSSTPSAGSGAAAPLVALALGAHLEAASVVVSEARVLSYAIGHSASELEITDAQTALDLFNVRSAS